jgi:hypothetical protein
MCASNTEHGTSEFNVWPAGSQSWFVPIFLCFHPFLFEWANLLYAIES